MTLSLIIRRSSVALAGVAAIAIPAGCGTKEIDGKKVENLIRTGFAKQGKATNLKSISCPDGLKVKKGATLQCKVVGSDGSKGTFTVTQLDNNGTVKVTGFTPGG
jgi:hypothetical protein